MLLLFLVIFFFFKQKTAYEMRISDGSSDVCSSDLLDAVGGETRKPPFLQKNPNGRIPVLELDDGSYLPESNAILFYLAEGSRYLPDDRLGDRKSVVLGKECVSTCRSRWSPDH